MASAKSEPQLKAITNGVRGALKEQWGLRPQATDGMPGSQWLVLDYGDVLVHVMQAAQRDFYALEDLWSDAPLVEWEKAEVPGGQ